MSKYEVLDKHFYSEELDVMVKALGAKGEFGFVMQVVYSGNEAYRNPLVEATESFLDDNFVECDYDYDTNELSFLGVDDDGTTP